MLPIGAAAAAAIATTTSTFRTNTISLTGLLLSAANAGARCGAGPEDLEDAAATGAGQGCYDHRHHLPFHFRDPQRGQRVISVGSTRGTHDAPHCRQVNLVRIVVFMRLVSY